MPARSTGYVQSVDSSALFQVAREERRLVRMERAVGEFVVEGLALAAVAPLATPGDGTRTPLGHDDFARAVAACFTVAAYRTVDQDAGFGVRQLVDIALKALSPGINDTTTAVSCVDYLGAILVRLAGRGVEVRARGDDGAYVLVRGPTFASLLGESVDEIRQNAAGNVSVLARLLVMLGWVRAASAAPARRELVAVHVALVAAAAERTVATEYDRARLRGLAGR